MLARIELSLSMLDCRPSTNAPPQRWCVATTMLGSSSGLALLSFLEPKLDAPPLRKTQLLLQPIGIEESKMVSGKLSSLLICCTWLLLLSASGAAQIPEGSLVGTVSDANGARVAGATVSAEAVGSSIKRQAVTNSVGEFRLEALPPNDYRVTATAPNFSPVTYVVRLTVNSSPTIPIILKPGPVTATVQVSGNESSLYSQPLETTSSVEKTVISKRTCRRSRWRTAASPTLLTSRR